MLVAIPNTRASTSTIPTRTRDFLRPSSTPSTLIRYVGISPSISWSIELYHPIIPPIDGDLRSSGLREQWSRHCADHRRHILRSDLHMQQVVLLIILDAHAIAFRAAFQNIL